MSTSGRTRNSFRNAGAGIVAQLVALATTFATRTVFIEHLGIEYLGVNGLFTNMLRVLSLAELGFGSAMAYRLYQPLALHDVPRTRALMAFFSKVYRTIGLGIAAIGFALIPALDFLIRDGSDFSGPLILIYALFILNSVSTYFFAHKWSLLIADQRGRVTSFYQMTFNVTRAVAQIAILVTTQNYIAFLLIQLATTVAEYAFVSKKADRVYPYLRRGAAEALPDTDIRSIWTDVKALAIFKIGGTVLEATDAVLISAFIGLATVGKFSNYTMITGGLLLLTTQITTALTAGVGNFAATQAQSRQESLLRSITFGHFVVYGLGAVCTWALINPFIEVWVGEEYLLSAAVAFLVALNWFLYGMMQPIWILRSARGLFARGRWRPAVTATLNIALSIALVGHLGVAGILLGTLIANALTHFWYDPLIIYRHGLGRPVKRYYLLLAGYAATTLVTMGTLSLVFNYIPSSGVAALVSRLGVSVAVFGGFIAISHSRTAEFREVRRAIAILFGWSSGNRGTDPL